jgi:hypothetical protein
MGVKVVAADQQYIWPAEPINTIELTPSASAYFAAQAQDGPMNPGDVYIIAATTIIYPPRLATGVYSPIALATCNRVIYISPIVASKSQL